jgi:hypothetical protein
MIVGLYPKDWKAIALGIKQGVNWCCENCGRPCRKPGETYEDFEERVIEGSKWAIDYWESIQDDELGSVLIRRGKRFELGVAHLDHVPSNCDRSNLRALCVPCHCRYDLSQMPKKKMLRLERSGQLTLGI